MTPKKVEKIAIESMSLILSGYTFKDGFIFIKDEDIIGCQFQVDTKKIGGEIYLLIKLSIRKKEIESRWINFESGLGLTEGLFRTSFFKTFHSLDITEFPTLTPWGLKVDYNESEDWVKEQTRKIVEDYYLPFAEKLKDIHYCDQLINKDIEITEEVCKLSPIDGLPFRKIFIAEAANNPRLDEIKEAMRVFVNEQYILGKKENFEALCKIKPVFEKLFGT